MNIDEINDKPDKTPQEIEFVQHLNEIRAILNREKVEAGIDKELCVHLDIIEHKSLFTSVRDENDKPAFASFEKFLKWIERSARKELKATGRRVSKDAYKKIKEATVHNRIARCVKCKPPVERPQLQKLKQCKPEKQAVIWETAFNNAGGKRITGAVVHAAALQHGEILPVLRQSASEILKAARPIWKKLEPDLAALPETTRPLVLEMDGLLAKVGRRGKANNMKGPDPSSVDGGKQDLEKRELSGDPDKGAVIIQKDEVIVADAVEGKGQDTVVKILIGIENSTVVLIKCPSPAVYNALKENGVKLWNRGYRYDKKTEIWRLGAKCAADATTKKSEVQGEILALGYSVAEL